MDQISTLPSISYAGFAAAGSGRCGEQLAAGNKQRGVLWHCCHSNLFDIVFLPCLPISWWCSACGRGHCSNLILSLIMIKAQCSFCSLYQVLFLSKTGKCRPSFAGTNYPADAIGSGGAVVSRGYVTVVGAP
jgi:hypothetical protein